MVITHREGIVSRRLREMRIPFVILPYRDGIFTEEKLEKTLKGENLALIQSSYSSYKLAAVAHRLSLPHVWRIGGHPRLTMNGFTEQEKNQMLSMILFLSKRVICPSRYLASSFSAVSEEQVQVIYNGVELKKFTRKTRTKLQIGMIGHFTSQKRHFDFIHAVRKVHSGHPHAEFHMYGHVLPKLSSRKYFEKLQREVLKNRLDNCLSFDHGQTSDSVAFRELDVVTLPSIYEGASNAILEAMASGIPVVATSSGGNKELVEDGVTGLLVPPRDPESLARAFEKLLASSALRKKMGKNAFRSAQEVYSLQKCVKAYENVYEECTV